MNIFSFLSYVFVVTFTPGPNNIMSMINANNFGYKKTLKFMLGIFTGFIVIMLLSAYFNIILYNIVPKIKPIMSILGALYMSYLAISILLDNKDGKKNNTHRNKISAGFTLQFLNPKVILYGITVFSTFIVPYYKNNLYILIFAIFLAIMSFISINLWAMFGILFEKFLSKYNKFFNIIMSLLLLYSALSISGLLK